MPETIYTAVFFDNGTHMTITFRPSKEEIENTPFGTTVAVRKVGEMATEDFTGIAVQPMSDEIPTVSSGYPHITFSTFGNFKAGDIASKMCNNPEIITNRTTTDESLTAIFAGSIGRFMSDGTIQFE